MTNRGFILGFLEEIKDILEIYSCERGFSLLNPSLCLLIVVLIVSAVSFSKGIAVSLFVLFTSIILVFLSRRGFWLWVKQVFYVFLFVLFISIPLFFIVPGKVLYSIDLSLVSIGVTDYGLWHALVLVLRTTAASAIFTAVLMSLGWRGVVEGLIGLYVPYDLVLMVGFFMKYVPLFLKDICRMLAAREARLFSSRLDYVSFWRSLISIVGEILLRSYWRSSKLSIALRARGFGVPPHRRYSWKRISFYDLCLVFLFSIVILLVTMWG